MVALRVNLKEQFLKYTKGFTKQTCSSLMTLVIRYWMTNNGPIF